MTTFHLTYEVTDRAALEVARQRNESLGRDVYYARRAEGRFPQGFRFEVVGRLHTEADCGCVYDEAAMETAEWCDEHGEVG